MKKKTAKHALEIARSIYMDESSKIKEPLQYVKDGRIFVTDTHRIMEIDDLVEELPIRVGGEIVDNIIKYVAEDSSRELDYTLHKIPTVAEIKAGIREQVGRKLDRVIWSDGIVTINARWLYKAMEALNATVCYMSSTKPGKVPYFLYENDDVNAKNKILILPVVSCGKKGFYLGI